MSNRANLLTSIIATIIFAAALAAAIITAQPIGIVLALILVFSNLAGVINAWAAITEQAKHDEFIINIKNAVSAEQAKRIVLDTHKLGGNA